MNWKDTFYFFGIIGSGIASTATLYLTYMARQNAMREHLFKEQLSFFVALSKGLNTLISYFDDISLEDTPEEGKRLMNKLNNKIESQLRELETLVDTYELIAPQEIYVAMFKSTNEARKLYNEFLKGTYNDEKIETFFDSVLDLTGSMRECLGVDVLNDANRSIIRGFRRDQTEEE